MDEIADGIWHWSAYHDGIRSVVHSHFHAPSGTLLDPMEPPEGMAWFERAERAPQRIVLSNRHHRRHCLRFDEAFGGLPVLVQQAGLHEYADDQDLDVRGFAFGEELAPGVVAHEVGVLTPEETAVAIGGRALLFADALIRGRRGELAFVPDGLLGEDPEAIRAGLLERFAQLAETVEFDALLMAHGEPIPADGRSALRGFAQAGGLT
jgi:hypothetical protein